MRVASTHHSQCCSLLLPSPHTAPSRPPSLLSPRPFPCEGTSVSRLTVACLFSWKVYSFSTYLGWVSIASALVASALGAVFLLWIVSRGKARGAFAWQPGNGAGTGSMDAKVFVAAHVCLSQMCNQTLTALTRAPRLPGCRWKGRRSAWTLHRRATSSTSVSAGAMTASPPALNGGSGAGLAAEVSWVVA